MYYLNTFITASLIKGILAYWRVSNQHTQDCSVRCMGTLEREYQHTQYRSVGCMGTNLQGGHLRGGMGRGRCASVLLKCMGM